MISVGIVGGSGYTGAELLRLLAVHPQVKINVVTSRRQAGNAISALHPNLAPAVDISFTQPQNAMLKHCDCVFFAAPNGTAMRMAPELLDAGVKVIDLAADFRIKDITTWQHWYQQTHTCPDLLKDAVYGLPELHRQKIKTARLVANPGCYPTAVILGFLPLLQEGLSGDARLIADVKSGVSGAGRSANISTSFSEIGENFKAYKVIAHRHWPEIKQALQGITTRPVNLTFTPHLVPMVRGIFATLYISNVDQSIELHSLYRRHFAGQRFIKVLHPGALPETKHVRGSNTCMLSVHRPGDGDLAIVLSVIDNLVKGAAGQAIQNMNLMSGFDETLGLTQPGLSP